MKLTMRKLMMCLAIVGVTAAFSGCGTGNFNGQYTGLGHCKRCVHKSQHYSKHKSPVMYTKGSADQDYQK